MGSHPCRWRRYTAQSSESSYFGRQSPQTILRSVREQIASRAHLREAGAGHLRGSNDLRGCQGPRAVLSARTGRCRRVEDRCTASQPRDDRCDHLQSAETDAPEKDPIVAFFPADHHFADETQFARAVDRAFEAVHKHPELLILLGARAEKAEVEYGWIEPGTPLDDDHGRQPGVFCVDRFWEKPSAATARELLSRGCLWNTFVIAGRARAFLKIVESTTPHALRSFQPIADSRSGETETERAAAVYESLPAGDFSRDVLTHCPDSLAVLRMDGAGWGDLGTPEGVLAVMHGTAPAPPPNSFGSWLAAYRNRLEEVRRQAGGEPAPAERSH